MSVDCHCRNRDFRRISETLSALESDATALDPALQLQLWQVDGRVKAVLGITRIRFKIFQDQLNLKMIELEREMALARPIEWKQAAKSKRECPALWSRKISDGTVSR